MGELWQLSIHEAHRRLTNREATSVELTRDCLDRVLCPHRRSNSDKHSIGFLTLIFNPLCRLESIVFERGLRPAENLHAKGFNQLALMESFPLTVS